MDDDKRMLSAPSGPVVVVDVGARWGAAEAWRSLAPEVRIIGFDPDSDECARLNEIARDAGDEIVTYVPVALGARHETVDLYVTRQPACSSIYPPIVDLIERIPTLADITPEGVVSIHLEPLDDWCAAHDVDHVDVLKVDTQGSELAVLQGATRVLATCVLVECEVEFNPIYDGQPLFSDVDEFLRGQGFVLWRLNNLVHYTDDDVLPRLDAVVTLNADARPMHARIGGGQLYWADAFYVRSELCGPPDALDPVVARRAARVVRAAGFTDLAVRIRPDLAPELISEATKARRTRRQERRAARPSGVDPRPTPQTSLIARVVRLTRSAARRSPWRNS